MTGRVPASPIRPAFVALAALVAVLSGGEAQAQVQTPDSLDVQLFEPPPALGSTFTIARTDVPRHLTYEVGLAASWAKGLLIRKQDDANIVDWRMQAEVLGALGLFEWIELGVAVPVVVQNGASASDAVGSANRSTFVRAGDVRLSLKMPLLRGDFSLAGKMVVSLPSGDGDELTGADYWMTAPGAVVAWALGPVTLSGEATYRLRKRALLGAGPGSLEYDDELHLAAGLGWEFTDGWSAIAESQLRIGTGGRTIDANENPMEVDAGLRWQPATGLTVDVGGGTGVLAGYGAPTGRVFGIVRWASEREPCDHGPEDFDGYEDGDFCNDPDNDGDGVLDPDDDCPNDAEDVDDFLDGDGCPDHDNDADGVPDTEDECPLESEDRDGWQDLDGCPEPDNDEDGIEDGLDDCPMDPEDLDGYQDDDGCPEPGPEEATVTVTDTRILISERIYFDFDRDTIRSVSQPLLDQVADAVKDIPKNRRIRVEGYTDSAGNDQYNLDLSYRRARAVVEYLVSRGVEPRRIGYIGYGEKNAEAPNDSPEGRALNRRVEFTILEPGDDFDPDIGRVRP